MGKLKNAWIWVKRFRKRCGYGVHSPFAFDFITNVIYERSAYYAYSEVKGKLPRLLFRITNYAQPRTFLEAGTRNDALPILLAKPSVEVVREGEIDLLHIPLGVDYRRVFDDALPRMSKRGIAIVEGIHADRAHLNWWREVTNDPRTGINFDLYTVGIIMFNHERIKQNYIVNF